MENENINKTSLVNKFNTIIKEKKNLVISILLSIIIILIILFGYNYIQSKKNEQIADKFIRGGLYLSSKDLVNSKLIYEEIVRSKNKFYSPLALNEIIENNLETNNDKILDFFLEIKKINLDKDQNDLMKLKKALFLIKISKETEGKKILDEIVKDNSIWKEIALEILKQKDKILLAKYNENYFNNFALIPPIELFI